MRILSNSAKFSAGRPLLSAYNFLATMATTYSTYRLGAVVSLKFLAIENMPPHFSAHVYYGHTVGWIRIPLGTEVRLSSGDTRRWGTTSPLRKGAQQRPPPLFGPLLWPASPQARILSITRIVD